MKNNVLLILLLLATAAKAQTLPLKLWYDRPAQYFEESLPIGNGKMGALVYGGADVNTIYLNDITLWTGEPVDINEDAGAHKWIPEIRKALFNEDYALADSLQLHVQGHNSRFYQPLLTMNIEDNDAMYDHNLDKTVTDYYRELDINNAICRDRYTRRGVTYEREYFASNPDKVIAIRLKSNVKGMLNVKVSLTGQVPHHIQYTSALS